MSENNWYDDFFDGAFFDVWKNMTPAEDTKKEADFIKDVLKLKPDEKVLDIPCGMGRLTLELAE